MKKRSKFSIFQTSIGITLTPSLRVYAKSLPVITAEKVGSGICVSLFSFLSRIIDFNLSKFFAPLSISLVPSLNSI